MVAEKQQSFEMEIIMKQVFRSIAIATAIALTAACGAKVEVPPAHVGKVLTRNGFAPETLAPSKFRLEPCIAYCDKLVLLQANDAPFHEKMEVFMPEDKLNLSVEVRGTMSIMSNNSRTIDSLYDRITAVPTDDNDVNVITAELIYRTYGQPTLRGVVRNKIAEYTIADVMANREALAQTIHDAIVDRMEATSTPLMFSRFELADIQPPLVIIEAQVTAKKREIDIMTANADAEVKMVEAERDLEIAQKRRLVEREKAEAIAEQNQIAAASITPQLLEYRRLEVQERVFTQLANGTNEGLMIVPIDTNSINSTTEGAVFGRVAGKQIASAK